ncbi:hypothetical protein Barb7_01030 [Bacteroidales bacterium Barb7]|nr:hypothetical protein Barb7_01030 [Bacteroidales bacterium Barb7]
MCTGIPMRYVCVSLLNTYVYPIGICIGIPMGYVYVSKNVKISRHD